MATRARARSDLSFRFSMPSSSCPSRFAGRLCHTCHRYPPFPPRFVHPLLAPSFHANVAAHCKTALFSPLFFSSFCNGFHGGLGQLFVCSENNKRASNAGPADGFVKRAFNETPGDADSRFCRTSYTPPFSCVVRSGSVPTFSSHPCTLLSCNSLSYALSRARPHGLSSADFGCRFVPPLIPDVACFPASHGSIPFPPLCYFFSVHFPMYRMHARCLR